MPVVQGTVLDAAGDPVDGIVTLRLITSVDGSRPPAFLGGGVTVISQVQPDVDDDGTWSQNLIANAVVTPANTYYEVIQQALHEPAKGFAIVVPNGAGPYDVDSLIVNPPGSIAPAGLASHLGANPAHHASNIEIDPVGTISATRVQAALAEIAAESGTGSYVHNQVTAAPVWGPIPHNLGRVPVAYVVESTGDDLEPGRADPDVNTTTLDFDGVAVSGTAHFS